MIVLTRIHCSLCHLLKGSCWAFVAVQLIESMYLIKVNGTSKKTSTSVELSPQQIVDCCDSDHGCSSSGCDGGYIDDVST